MTQLQMTCLSPIFKLPSPEKEKTILDKFGHVWSTLDYKPLEILLTILDQFEQVCTILNKF